jgi:pyridinium-3,5-bisthiocarboxylic acid mononucleotide nickel chelatase
MLQGLHLHVDAASGIAGDMTLAALLDLGVPRAVIDDALEALGLGRQRLTVRRVVKGGIAALDVQVDDTPLGLGHRHGAAHGPGEAHPAVTPHPPGHGDGHPHVHYAAIRDLLDRLSGEVQRRAVDIFARIARAEASLHGTTIEAVAFHEVGAVDSIVDVVGTAAALAWLAPASVSCAAVAMGSGTLRSAHGVLPVPAPAALEILREAGATTTDGGVARELCTPTGAAILAHAVTAWRPAPTGTPLCVGWGAGDADLADRANVLRLVLSRPAAASAGAAGLWRVEATVDDLSAELAAHALERVLAAGAVDGWWTAVTMKKGRPGLQLTALAPATGRDAVIAAILDETTTIGVRFDPVERHVLAREVVAVETPFGPIPIKVARDGDRIVNAAPEFEDCRAAAARAGVPLKAIYAAAVAAWERRRRPD